MAKSFLKDVYDVGITDSRELYASWAATYDKEVKENGYVTPKRIADALKDIVSDQSELILDYGCGTGLSGSALWTVGFKNIDGLDVSEEMINLAKKKSIYRNLGVFEPSNKIPVQPEQYKIITAVGVIGAGAAPLQVFSDLLSLLPSNGLLAFSFNDHTLSDPSYEKEVDACLKVGKALMVHKSYGKHLPKANLNSNIYILKKL